MVNLVYLNSVFLRFWLEKLIINLKLNRKKSLKSFIPNAFQKLDQQKFLSLLLEKYKNVSSVWFLSFWIPTSRSKINVYFRRCILWCSGSHSVSTTRSGGRIATLQPLLTWLLPFKLAWGLRPQVILDVITVIVSTTFS